MNKILIADYQNTDMAKHVLFLLNEYAKDPMGGGQPLTDYTQQHLIENLKIQPGAFSVLCYVDDKPAGLINCLQGFSTFKCKPLINIHDVVVLPEFRGLGISAQMFDKVETIARERGCCKLTLEVLTGNESAQKAYVKSGFSGYELDPLMGKAMFWEKTL